MVSYLNQLRSVPQRSLRSGRQPGSLALWLVAMCSSQAFSEVDASSHWQSELQAGTCITKGKAYSGERETSEGIMHTVSRQLDHLGLGKCTVNCTQ